MANEPHGQEHPANVIGCAVTVATIATGKIKDTKKEKSLRAKLDRVGGRALKLTQREHSDITTNAAHRRWLS